MEGYCLRFNFASKGPNLIINSGFNHIAADSYLKDKYNENLSLQDAQFIAVKALLKTMDTANPSPSKSKPLIKYLYIN